MNRSKSRGRARLNSVTLTAAAVSLIMLAGCASMKDKSNETISQAVGSLEQSVINVAEEWGQRSKEAGLFRDISTSRQVDKATKLRLDHSVGSIKVSAYNGEEIRINTTVWFGKSTKPESRQRILDQAEVSVIEKGDQITIVTHPAGEQNKSLWAWAQKKYGFSDFMIDYVIEVPSNIESYEIRNDVGVVELVDLKGSYELSSEVGSIRMDNAVITGKSSIRTSTGSVEMHIAEMGKESQLNVKTEVGNIKATLDDSVQCTLVTKTEVGKITGAAKGTSEINGGGGELLLESQIGMITLE